MVTSKHAQTQPRHDSDSELMRRRNTPAWQSLAMCVVGFYLISGIMTLVSAAPLDDKITAFEKAAEQTDGAVSGILQAGLNESRSAAALAAVKQWLDRSPDLSQKILFEAGLSAERAGDAASAAGYYSKLLDREKVEAKWAAQAAPSLYRLYINQLNDPGTAYGFMRNHGAKLRGYGRAGQFDSWFFEQARRRNDLIAMARWLTAIYSSSDNDERHARHLEFFLRRLESYQHREQSLIGLLPALAEAKHTSEATRARLNWVMKVLPVQTRAAESASKKKEVSESIFNSSVLGAGEKLVAVMPYRGSIIVADGWMHFNAGDSGVFRRFVDPRRAEKAAPILQALRRMPVDQAQQVLNHSVAGGKGRRVAGYLFSGEELRRLVNDKPAIFNALDAPNVSLFSPKLTVDQAKSLAPHLARNPHSDAALVRAYAAAGEMKVSAILPRLMKSEHWRFGSVKKAVEFVWNSGAERDGNEKEWIKQYESVEDDYLKWTKRVSEKANQKTRMDAFNQLRKDLVSSQPSIVGATSLWKQLFSEASDEDRISMLTVLTSQMDEKTTELVRRAIEQCDFGGQRYAKLRFGPEYHDNWNRWGKKPIYKVLPEFSDHLAGLLRKQMQQGKISEPLLGMWLYSADPSRPESQKMIKELVDSQAYAKVPRGYHALAARGELFGAAAYTDELRAESTRHRNRELLTLTKESKPDDVEKALEAVVKRLEEAPEVFLVMGLDPVASLPKWSGKTRDLVLSLFRENAPLGDYPEKQGYEPLVQRVVKELSESGSMERIEPYVGGMWHAAASTDDGRFYRGAADLSKAAKAALDAGAASMAMTIARCGLQSRVAGRLASSDRGNLQEISNGLSQVMGEAAAEIGAFEIPVDETDPSYPIYKSNTEFALGNLESAWTIYEKHADQLKPVLSDLPAAYGLWLLQRNIEAGEEQRAEELVKDLTIWSRQNAGVLTAQEDAKLKISYAELAFRKGALPTARAWFRKVADAAEYEGTRMHLEAALGSVKVDRVSKNFSAALSELDRLMQLNDPEFRKRVRYVRAEVLMDQENYAEALNEVESVLRQDPKHPDALILRGQIHYKMRKLVEASEIELGPSQNETVIVPGEAVKINLRDPTLSISGLTADIEVEVWADSGDKERVLLYQLGDSKEKFRAEVPTELGPPTPGDKKLQVLGKDKIRFGYSKRFRERMEDLPPDPDIEIEVASDARLDFSAGAFPPREGERRLNIEELGISTAQAKLGMRAVRPGNQVYLRLTDPDQSVTSQIDEIKVDVEVSSGDQIRQFALKETSPYSGEFEGVIETTGAQAMAFASESAPGHDPNMAISAESYPGWQGVAGEKEATRTFGIDFNDKVGLGTLSLDTGGSDGLITHYVIQTSMNGKDWTTRARQPAGNDVEAWDGRPYITSFPTYGNNALSVAAPDGRELPADWKEKMELISARKSINYMAKNVTGLSEKPLPFVKTSHPGYSGLIRYRAIFYQPSPAIRQFRVDGLPLGPPTVFLLDGEPAPEDSENPLSIKRELKPGLHTIELWRNESRGEFSKHKPVMMCDESGKDKLVPCPDRMFDPLTFPDGVRAKIPKPATVRSLIDGKFEVDFEEGTDVRFVRFVIQGFNGTAPKVKKLTMDSRSGESVLPVAQDFMKLRNNQQLEVLPGDQIVARYTDPVSATPGRERKEQRLGVAFNTATLTASFLNYKINKEGERELMLESIRRFRYDDPIAIVIDDADLDVSPQRDVIEFKIESSEGKKITLKAVETEVHSGRFMGRVFPVEGEPSRESEIQLIKGGSLTAIYRDEENLDPGIPTDRETTITHAQFVNPKMDLYTQSSDKLPATTPPKKSSDDHQGRTSSLGPETVYPRRSLSYEIVEVSGASSPELVGLMGADVRFDVVIPHMALAKSSEIRAYVQTEAARRAAGVTGDEFDVKVPGTLKLTGALGRPQVEAPSGYTLVRAAVPPSNVPPLEEGRFSFQLPLILGDPPVRSFATKDADELPSSSIPEGLAVKNGDVVHVGFPWQNEDGKVFWESVQYEVRSHAFLDVMEGNYRDHLERVYVGEKIFVRLVAPGLDRGPNRDVSEVTLKGTSGASTRYQIKETEPHSGVFKGVFTVSYAAEEIPDKLPPVALNGFPVRYGDEITVSYDDQSYAIEINRGADGKIEPFSKRFSGDEMAVETSFTLAECYFELAKKHRKMDQESLARREIGHARKLLSEALATHHDEELKAHAEYLLANLAQEFADLAKNEASKLPMYQDALARFSKIPTDYPESEFASKAQFKTALVYEKMGEIENAVEEYVKLAYKYPNDELIPTVMARLGGYFQKKGQKFKDQADTLRENEDKESRAEVLRLDELSYPEFLNAAMVFRKLQERFPDDSLAGLAGLRAAQNFMRAHQYREAIAQFERVVDNEDYDGRDIRSQAVYWSGLSYERLMGTMSKDNWRGRGEAKREAYELYRRVTFDFPDSKWAKFARGRLADPAFGKIIEKENQERNRMIEALKEQ